jgi:hypothetical protein
MWIFMKKFLSKMQEFAFSFVNRFNINRIGVSVLQNINPDIFMSPSRTLTLQPRQPFMYNIIKQSPLCDPTIDFSSKSPEILKRTIDKGTQTTHRIPYFTSFTPFTSFPLNFIPKKSTQTPLEMLIQHNRNENK